MQCLAGKSQFWINWDGTLVPCGMLVTPVTETAGREFSEAWEQLKVETAAIRLCPDCAGCSEKQSCMNCAAVVYTETGSFEGRPEYMCRMNQAYREALNKYATE